MNLYMNLLQIERVLGFGLAAECLVWYHLALANLARELDSPRPRSQTSVEPL